MAVNNVRNMVAYGLTQALENLPPQPIIAKRDPKITDFAILGTLWIEPLTNSVWVLTSIIGNSANWESLGGSGAGVFGSLVVNPGPTSLSTVGSGTVTIGNSANAFPVNINSGTGGVNINGNGNTIDIGVDAAANAVFVGSTTNGAVTTIQGGNGTGIGTAAVLITSAAAGDIFIGGSAHTGIISMGNSTAASGETVNIANSLTGGNTAVNILSGVGTAGANTLALGNNTRVTTIGIGNIAPAAARTTTIAGGNSAQNDTVAILNGAPSANTQTFNLMSGTATGGTQAVNIGNGIGGSLTVSIGNGVNSTAQVVNIANGATGANSTVNILSNAGTAGTQVFNVLGNGATRAGAANIGTGAAAHTVTIGSTTSTAQTVIQAGTTGLALIPTGGIATLQPATVSAAAYAATLNANVGAVTLTGQVLAAGSVQVLTITNSICTTASKMLVTVANLGANDAQLNITRIQPQAGSFLVTVKNDGAAALNGDIHVTFWIIAA